MKNKHSIDFLFTLVLFSMFVIMCVLLINIGAGVYDTISNRTSSNSEVRTTLSYIGNKVRAASAMEEPVRIDIVDGTKVLVISSENKGNKYNTLIFYKEGYIREATVMDGDEYTLDFGTNLVLANEFDFQVVNEELYYVDITVNTPFGDKSSLKVNINDLK
ncbi:MAG: DUF4860 domain-containing protein [Clostridiales bacterium]|nr:DUF4860 domain-containing protein [Clostridiales bacterium]